MKFNDSPDIQRGTEIENIANFGKYNIIKVEEVLSDFFLNTIFTFSSIDLLNYSGPRLLLGCP